MSPRRESRACIRLQCSTGKTAMHTPCARIHTTRLSHFPKRRDIVGTGSQQSERPESDAHSPRGLMVVSGGRTKPQARTALVQWSTVAGGE